jgi:hypothetical protein
MMSDFRHITFDSPLHGGICFSCYFSILVILSRSLPKQFFLNRQKSFSDLSGMASSSAKTPFISTQGLYEFPNPTWIENLFIRSNGEILLTSLSKPELYLLDPYATPQKPPTLLHVSSCFCSDNTASSTRRPSKRIYSCLLTMKPPTLCKILNLILRPRHFLHLSGS